MVLPTVTPYVLPGLDESEVREWLTLSFSGGTGGDGAGGDGAGGAPSLRLRFPKLTPEQLGAVMEHLGQARDAYLAELPVLRVAELLDRAVSRWLEPHSAWRRLAEQLLPVVTGYPEPVIRKGLAGYLATFRLENTRRLLEEELRDPRFLDELRPRGAVGG